MPVSDEYRLFVLEEVGRVAPVTSRKMFGGIGLYSGGLFFALIDNDTLFFKVDEATRPSFEAAGSLPFEPWEGHVMPGYWELPAGALEDEERLREYVAGAVRAASAKKDKKAANAKKTSAAGKPRRGRAR